MDISIPGIFIGMLVQILPTKALPDSMLKNVEKYQTRENTSTSHISHPNYTEIDWNLNELNQDDPKLINVLKKHCFSFPDDSVRMEFRVSNKKAYGQFGQTSIVDQYYNYSKRNGFFIETGAYDGKLFSNQTPFSWR